MQTPLDYEPREPEPRATLREWIGLLWPWALIFGFVALCAYMILAHPGGD
jgi:hypothetical protein